MSHKFAYCVCAVLIILVGAIDTSFADSPEQIFVKTSPSVVVVDILNSKGESIGLGSGVVIAKYQVVTNCHVAQMGNRLKVGQYGKSFNAILQYADPERDLCQLSVPDLIAPSVILGSVKNLRVGQRVYAVGAPKGLDLTLSEGLLSSLRPYGGSQYIQTSAAISPGSSGGGLFDLQGKLIGITTFQIIDGQNLNFALPVDWIGELPKRAEVTLTKNKYDMDWGARALALDEKGDWEGLLKLCHEWIKSKPRSSLARYNQGIAYGKLNRYEEAVKSYLDALKIDEKNTIIWNQLGNTYSLSNQYELAIMAYEEALRIDPEFAASWRQLGNLYFSRKEFSKSIPFYQNALNLDPEDAELWESLSLTYSLDGKLDKAIQSLLKAISLEPKQSDYWKKLGLYYTGISQLVSATKAYQEALRIQPDDPIAWSGLAGVYVYLLEYDKAITAYKESLRLKPEDAGVWWGLADSLKNKNEYEQSVKAYREAVRIQPMLAGAWSGLGSVYNSLGQRDKVMDVYQIIRKINPVMADQYFKTYILP